MGMEMGMGMGMGWERDGDGDGDVDRIYDKLGSDVFQNATFVLCCCSGRKERTDIVTSHAEPCWFNQGFVHVISLRIITREIVIFFNEGSSFVAT